MDHERDHGWDQRADLVLDGFADRTAQADDRLELPFAARCRSRQRAMLASGRRAYILVPRGTVLRGGDRLVGPGPGIVEVVAIEEALLEVSCDAHALARAAYHLGNRHVPVELAEGRLYLAVDGVLEALLRALAVEVRRVLRPFEPEAGAYAAHSHALPAAARIHAFGEGEAGGASSA